MRSMQAVPLIKRLGTSNTLVSVLLVIGTAVGQEMPRNVVTTTGKSQIRYCDSDVDLAVAIIHTTIDFANHGEKSVILTRKLGDVEDLSVSDASGNIVYSPHPSYYGLGFQSSELHPILSCSRSCRMVRRFIATLSSGSRSPRIPLAESAQLRRPAITEFRRSAQRGRSMAMKIVLCRSRRCGRPTEIFTSIRLG